MTDLIVIFRTPSQIEADVVRGLLETHGIATMVSSDMSRTPFPLAVNELRIAVQADERRTRSGSSTATARKAGPGGSCPSGQSSSRSSGASATASRIAGCSSTR